MDGNHAYLLLQKALTPIYLKDARYSGGGGVYPNLLTRTRLFQIDGNLELLRGLRRCFYNHTARDPFLPLAKAGQTQRQRIERKRRV